MHYTKRGLSCLVISSLSFALAQIASAATIYQGPFTNPGNGHQYFLLMQDTWKNSEAAAVAMGGHLASIADAAEQTWIYNTFESLGGEHRNLWIGLYNPTKDALGGQHPANFVWSDGSPVDFTKWSSGEPNNIGNLGEWYVNIWRADAMTDTGGRKPGTWNDAIDDPYSGKCDPNTLVVNGVVELVPEPGMAIMLPLAGGLLFGRVRRSVAALS